MSDPDAKRRKVPMVAADPPAPPGRVCSACVDKDAQLASARADLATVRTALSALQARRD